MSKTLCQKPCMLIDLRKNRIRIHKITLHLLGNPEYISLMVNPSSRSIAIQASTKKDPLAHRIRWKNLAGKNSYELYSSSLMKTLREVYFDWNDNHCYRIYGNLYPDKGVSEFSMVDSVVINPTTSEGADFDMAEKETVEA